MKLNNKGYMLIEIILASALAFGIAYFLLNLTYKFKKENEYVYQSIESINTQNLITKNIMDDIGRGNISSATYTEATKALDFKIKLSTNVTENRRLLITDNTIEYGKTRTYKENSFITTDISYYKKTLPKNVKIKSLEFNESEETDFSTFKIVIDSLYDDNSYDIKLLLSKKGIIDDQEGNCYKITLNSENGATDIYLNYSTKKIYANQTCTGTPLTSISIPEKQVIMPAIYYNLDGGTGSNVSNKRYQNFNSYRYNNQVLINSAGALTTDTNILASISSDITLEPIWDSTYYIKLPTSMKSMVTCEGWYSDSERLNRVGDCAQKIPANENTEITYYIKWEQATYALSNPDIGIKTLKEAISRIAPNGTITMQKNDSQTTQTTTIRINKSFKLNLNNKTLSLNNCYLNVQSDGIITITSNGTITGTGSYIFENDRHGSIVIKNGTFINDNGVLIKNLGSLKIDNGTFKGCHKTLINNGATTSPAGITTIKDGIFKTSKSSCTTQTLLKNYSIERDENNYSVSISGGVFWNGGAGKEGQSSAFKNMEGSTNGYGIAVLGTTLNAYSKNNYVVYAESGRIRLSGGNYYSKNAKFTKAIDDAKISTGANYKERKTELSEPIG